MYYMLNHKLKAQRASKWLWYVLWVMVLILCAVFILRPDLVVLPQYTAPQALYPTN